ncbi:MAG: hypothetical protein P4N59_14420 [Negativicutes bacterium]|nr:hypothetical protein [Negativicutes bacterium]
MMDIEDLETQPVDEYEQPTQYPTDQASESARPNVPQENNIAQAPSANENAPKPNQPGDQSTPAPAGASPLVEWKFTNPAANGLLTSPNTVKNANQITGLNYSSYPELVQTYNATWQRNFQYILGPANPIFVDAKLSYQDIAWGYRLEPNPNGVLWRVSAAGIPHPDDYNNFIEQNRVIETTNNRTNAEIKPLIDTAVKAGTGVKTQESSKAGDGNVTQDNGTINKDTDMLLRANGFLPGQAKVVNVTYSRDEAYLDEHGINTDIPLRQAVKIGIAQGILPDPATMNSDYKFIEGGAGIGKFVSGAAGLMMDKKGNVYAIFDGSVGYGLGPPVTGSAGQGYFGNADKSDANAYRDALEGLSFGATTGAGIQGNVSVGTSGVTSGEVSLTPGIGKTVGGRYTVYLFNIYD